MVSGSSYHVRVRSISINGTPSAWEGPVTIAASSDASTVSASVAYADITGTKPPSDADNTSTAVNAGTTVTAAAGGITFSANGAIKGGQTDYNTGTGWFLGYSSGAYKFSIGNPVGNQLTWNGSNLTISGNILKTYQAGATLLLGTGSSSATIRYPSYKECARFIINEGVGTVTVVFSYFSSVSSSNAYYKITRNGTIVGSGVNSTASTTINVSLNVAVQYGDVISIHACEQDNGATCYISGMAIKYSTSTAQTNSATYY
jgi:hypothetical protein